MSDLAPEQRLRLRGLSPRESEVTLMVIRGWRGRQIAAQLGIAGSTVKNVLASAREKLGCASTRDLPRVMVGEGLVRPEELTDPNYAPPATL